MRCGCLLFWSISIHSLVKRETIRKNISPRRNDYFNPLPRKEGDDWLSYYPFDGKHHFNPLPRKEGDARGQYHGLYIEIFQSTPS